MSTRLSGEVEQKGNAAVSTRLSGEVEQKETITVSRSAN
jgi:hypothetical protein